MLCLIGETFDDHSKYVNGAVVSVRNKGDKIGMWLGDASQQSSIMTIGKMVKERLGIDARVRKNHLHRYRVALLRLFFLFPDNARVRGASGHNEEVWVDGQESVRRLREEGITPVESSRLVSNQVSPCTSLA